MTGTGHAGDAGDAGRAGLGVRLVDRTISIAAAPERVYALLTDATGLVRWMAPEAVVEPVVGGVITWRHANGDRCSGRFLHLQPPHRVVFSYGWDAPEVGIPPGSTTVEITLRPVTGGTELYLVHRGLSGPMADAHGGGWRHYLTRLTALAEGHDPGPDTLADQRVPAATGAPR